MRLIFFACSKKACDKMQETKERWLAENPEDEIICVVKCKALGELFGKEKPVAECTQESGFKGQTGLFISAQWGLRCAVLLLMWCISPMTGRWW